MKLGIIVGSIRQGRVSAGMAQWVAAAAQQREGVEVELIDLKDFALPFFDEAISPQYNPDRKPEGEAKRWLDKLAEQDAFVIVTPEYNRSIPGVLKNAFDFIAYEMTKKPVAIATHGSSSGAQAVAQLRGIVPGMLAVTTPTFVGLPYAEMQNFDENGTYSSDKAEMYSGLLNAMLDELVWYGDALSTARQTAK